ncbi:SO2930 family diheme c-type cytochrome [Corallococcus carmarthensis]|uniref:SO2930 family diheme c-type cytochrome n=1 Tax=Corallococcus carmarthensis TaxID=2316728 RepID=UPI0024473108|nr:SO2930 family diheme c-type cytochrome [Corallococcus carmarthensis]
MSPRLSVVLLALTLAACGSSDPEGPGTPPDAGTTVPDAGTGDAGGPDAGEPDAGSDAGTDAGTADAGVADAGPVDAGPPLVIPNTLSGFGLFTGSPADGGLVPVEGNVPYTLSTALFSDYAVKSRTLYIPPGKTAHYEPVAALDLPVGTLITKTFAFPADLRQPDQDVRVIETRVLVHQPAGWEAWPYVWNTEQTEATLATGGRSRDVTFIDLEGETRSFKYSVPSKNQCQQCHHLVDETGAQVMHPIGVKARYLHRPNTYGGVEHDQLEYLASLGKLDGLPAPANLPKAPDAFDPQAADLPTRARTYLDINCAHCHNPKGTAGITSQLFLNFDNASLFSLGECKRPGSAGAGVGGEFDIVPGNHAESILWYRMHTEESGKMMPQIGRTVHHAEGSQLIADWIDSMPAKTCK